MAKSKRANIRQLSKGKWLVDWGRNTLRSKTQAGKNGRMVGRRSQHDNKKAAESYAAEVIAEVNNGKALSLTTTRKGLDATPSKGRPWRIRAGFTNESHI